MIYLRIYLKYSVTYQNGGENGEKWGTSISCIHELETFATSVRTFKTTTT